ncbi:MAG: hypothetical protein RBT57_01920 [Paludibacter sp.]|jgi:hypothetical protein|nr:hypothetical protein [Paludibacter sp.]
MKTKESYLAPDINLIRLDNDISLQLQSDNTPAEEPTNWSYNQSYNDPLKNQLA